jgi:Zn-dependent protease with chaperone function
VLLKRSDDEVERGHAARRDVVRSVMMIVVSIVITALVTRLVL